MNPKIVQKIVDEMDYDFSQFSMAGFVAWVAQKHGKPIRLESYPDLPVGISGLWLSTPSEEVICHQDNLPPLREMVTLLHELAHIYLQHSTCDITNLPAILIDLIRDADQALAYRKVYTEDSDDEAEAEAMALLLLKQVLSQPEPESHPDTPGAAYMKMLKVI